MTSDPHSNRVAALILSAGKSTRALGFKPLFKWQDETYISKIHNTLTTSGSFYEILVVTGHNSDILQRYLKMHQIKWIFNPTYTHGMHSSIKTGLKALKSDWTSVLIVHVDQPHLEKEDYQVIVKSGLSSGKPLARPSFQGKHGNPSLIGNKFFEEILSEPDRDFGCSYLFDRHPHDVHFIEMKSDRTLYDYGSNKLSEIASDLVN